jgi:hypothetical protein
MARHYHAGYNTEGYLPEMDPITTTSRRSAAAFLAEEARRFRDDDYIVTGNAREGDMWATPRGTSHLLDTHLWWVECNDDCEVGE